IRTTSLLAARSMSIELMPADFSFSFSSLRSLTSSCSRSAYSRSAYQRDFHGLLSPSRNPYGCVFCPIVIPSCPSSEPAVCRSKPCARGVRCHERPCWLLLRQRWWRGVPPRPHNVRRPVPRDARFASGNGIRAPSARDAYASSAHLRSRSTWKRTADRRRAALPRLRLFARRWLPRCAAPFQSARRRVSACSATCAAHPERAVHGSSQSPDALFAATSGRGAPEHAPRFAEMVYLGQPCLMPSAPALLPVRRLPRERPRPPFRVPPSRRGL